MGLAAVDECVRNLVCVGADPSRIAILDNFCWPSCKDPHNMGALVRAAWACYDAAKAYRTPFISGKDSLNNQFVTEDGRTIQIPPTLLISGFAIVNDIHKSCTMDLKGAGNSIVLVGSTSKRLGGSHWALLAGIDESSSLEMPCVDLTQGPRIAATVANEIASGGIRSAHDCSEGGLLVAVAEMAFAGGIGAQVDLAKMPISQAEKSAAISAAGDVFDPYALAFAEDPSRYILEVKSSDAHALRARFAAAGISSAIIGQTDSSSELRVCHGDIDLGFESLEKLRAAWSSGSSGW